jgi:hypothetical protein
MAKKKEAQEEAPATPLVEAAKTVGEAAGKVVATFEGIAKKSQKIPKLAPKNKSRLPRKAKKAKQKAHDTKAQQKALKRKQK